MAFSSIVTFFNRHVSFWAKTLALGLLSTSLYAKGDILSIANDLNPNEDGLPPPLEKTTDVSIVLF